MKEDHPMLQWEKVLSSLYKSTGLASFILKDGIIRYTSHHKIDDNILNTPEITKLIELCIKNENTNIMINTYHLAIAGMYIQETNDLLLLGFFFLGSRSDKETYKELLNSFGNEQFVKETMHYFVMLPQISKRSLISILSFLNQYINDSSVNLTQRNFIINDKDYDLVKMFTTKEEQLYQEIDDEAAKVFDQYVFEQHIMECIQRGDKERLLSYQKYDANVESGVLSEKKDIMRQRKNEVICACTLASRAAIQGGLSVEQSYALASFYIQKAESMHIEENMQYLVRQMFLDFTIRVARIIDKNNTYSSITTLTMNYVYEHVYEYISAEIIAEAIQVSKNYILTLFKKETGTSLVDFIKQIKVSEAKLLLEYSEYSLIEISDMLSCSSQSFFTTMFHRIEGTTPRQYRESKRKVV